MTLATMLRRLLEEELRRQGFAGLVVWYDPGATLASVAGEAVPEGAQLVRFAGSYLALRLAVESQDPELGGRWVIYVPERPLEESWLRDWELLGARWDVDLLELLRRAANLLPTPGLAELLRRPENARDLVQAWDTLIADQPLSEAVLVDVLLALNFGLPRWQPEEGILLFASGTVGQRDLAARGLWLLFIERVGRWAGWEEVPDDETALRRRLEATLLLSELVEAIPELSSRFAGVLPPASKRSLAASLARAWRDREHLRGAYLEAARRVEREYDLDRLLTPQEALLGVDTFLVVDHLWRREVLSALAPDGANLGVVAGRVAKVAAHRGTRFWARQGMAAWWRPMALAADLLEGCRRAVGQTEVLSAVRDFLDRYGAEDGWWRLDLWALQLAAELQSLSPEEQIRLIRPAWRAYADFLDRVNRSFADAVQREGWAPGFPGIWERYTSGRPRTAVFFADALRYDLARHLRDLLTGAGYEVVLTALPGALPSVTEVGMAALLPEAEAGLEVAAQAGDLSVRLRGMEVSRLHGRQELLQQHLGPQARIVKLGELERANTRGVSLLVVLSQEIDRFGTFAADLDPESLLDMVGQIARGIHHLRDRGFYRFVVAADHGFLFLPPGVEPQRIDVPPNAVCKHRFAVGASDASCVVKTAVELGLTGQEIFAFPAGLAVFALQGEIRRFLHGGLSLQECVVPLLEANAEPSGEKVSVGMELPARLTSRFASIRVAVREAELFAMPRRVVIEINGRRSYPKELSPDHREDTLTVAWLGFDENPPRQASVRLLDADSGQVVEEAIVPVEMAL